MKKACFFFLALLCQYSIDALGNPHSPKESDMTSFTMAPKMGDYDTDSSSGAPVIVYLELSSFPLIQDTLVLESMPYFLSRNTHNFKQKSYTQIGTPKSFFYGVSPTMDQVFQFETEPYFRPGYISLKNSAGYILKDFVVLPGDSIMVRVDKTKTLVSFAGPSAKSFQCQYEMASAKESNSFSKPTRFITKSKEDFLELDDYRSHYLAARSSFGGYLDIIEEGEEQVSRFIEDVQMHWTDDPQWERLKQYKGSLNEDLFEILKGEIIGSFYTKLIKTFNRDLYAKFYPDKESQAYQSLMAAYSDHISALSLNEISDKAGAISINYLEFLGEWIYAKAIVERLSMTAAVNAVFEGELKEKLLSQYLANHFNFIANKERYMEKANPEINSVPWRFVFDQYYLKQQAGALVENFAFLDKSGRHWSKEDFADKYVIFYFWFYGCGASANFYEYQISRLQDLLGDAPEVRIVSVSVDRTMELWDLGLASGKYTDKSLLNLHIPQSEVSWLENYNIKSFPHLLIMDKRGQYIGWEPDEKNADGLWKKLENLR
ncbi:TlpA family protein disulfide reductase [Litoribacter populi]|uniref:TlpA family protein disulfide reductase n=1 Tax=Litoribacter populi TaxID=2598460 RepID=UPI00117C8595|nr:thioredoxin family protein [Litoribacter populi]